jgi:hypothetical protein
VKAQEAERRGPRPAGYPSNIPEFRTEMPFLTDFLVWGHTDTASSESDWPKMLFLAQGASQDLVVQSLVDPDPSPVVEALNSEANAR